MEYLKVTGSALFAVPPGIGAGRVRRSVAVRLTAVTAMSPRRPRPVGTDMTDPSKAFHGFAVPDTRRAPAPSYADVLGIEVTAGERHPATPTSAAARRTIVYPKPDHVPATVHGAQLRRCPTSRRPSTSSPPVGVVFEHYEGTPIETRREGRVPRRRTAHRLVHRPGRQHLLGHRGGLSSSDPVDADVLEERRVVADHEQRAAVGRERRRPGRRTTRGRGCWSARRAAAAAARGRPAAARPASRGTARRRTASPTCRSAAAPRNRNRASWARTGFGSTPGARSATLSKTVRSSSSRSSRWGSSAIGTWVLTEPDRGGTVPAIVSSSVVLPAPFGPTTATRSGPRRSSSTAAPVRSTSPSVVSTTRPRGTSVAGRSTRIVAVLAQPRLGVVEPVPGRLEPVVVDLAVRRRGLLRAVLARSPGAPCPCCVRDRVALRPGACRWASTRSASTRSAFWRRRSDRAAVTACSAASCSARTCSAYAREPAAVPPHRAVAEVADPVHPLEQLAVVADHEQGARPGAEHVVEPAAGRRRRGCWSARRGAARRAGAAAAGPGRAGPPRRRTARRAGGRARRRAARAARARRWRAPRRPSRRRRPRRPPGRRSRRRGARSARSAAPMPRKSSTRLARSRVRSCGR